MNELDRVNAMVESKEMSGNKRGPMLAGVYDQDLAKLKGNSGYYFGLNDYKGKPPADMHPTLQNRLDNMPVDIKDSYPNTKGAGSHAELYALNPALLARHEAGLPDDENALNRIMLDVVTTKKVGQLEAPGTSAPRCTHCEYLTDGVHFVNTDAEQEMKNKNNPNQSPSQQDTVHSWKDNVNVRTNEFTVNQDPNVYLYRQNLFNAEAKTDAAYEASASATGKYGSANADIAFMQGQANANADFAIKPDGMRLESDFEAGYYLAKGKADAETNIGGVDLHASASGDVGPSVKGSADLALGMVDGQLQAGVDAELGAYLAKGEVSGGFKIFGIDVTGRAQGKVGAGVEAGIGFKDGKFSANLGATLGLGGSLGVEIDCSELIENVGEFADDAGEFIDDAGEFIGDSWNNVTDFFGNLF